MKIKVYQSKEDKYVEMEVVAQYKYIGETNELSFINGKIYNCVGYDEEHNMIRLVDETDEDYLYSADNFKLINCDDKNI